MENWKARYASKLVGPQQATSLVKNGDRVFLGSMCSEPSAVIEALGASYLEDLEFVQFITGHKAAELVEKYSDRFRIKTFFVGGAAPRTEAPSEADYLPLFHSQIGGFFRNRRIPIDVAIVQVSEPDRFGRLSLGISVDVALAAVESARRVIAQVNPRMPRTNGDTFIPAEKVDYMVEAEEDLYELPEEVLGNREQTISGYVSELIDDGSILQFGFAGISRGLMDFLKEHRHLGLHTEIFTDRLIDLIEAGAVDNSTKKVYRGKSLASCCMGTRRLYEYVHENSLIELYPSDVLLDPAFIAANEKMVAVNLALQVDLRGQIRQGSPTWTAFEGSGGDHDFMRGATLSRGGRSIICLRSTSLRSGRSTIVPSFGSGAAVVSNRGDVNYVVTEYGIAYLGGKSVRERAMALIEIAHPDHRENLMKEARELGYVYSDQIYYQTASAEFRRRIRTDRVFRGGLKGHIRVIKPTDEAGIRDLFYNLSEESVYFRYFSPRRSMPHKNVQQYCSLTEDKGLSLVVTTGPRERRRIIAEARYVLEQDKENADCAFMVDGSFQRRGIASALLHYLIEAAKERGVKGLRADVLFSNKPMMAVFEKLPYVLHKKLEDGIISLQWNFNEPREPEVPGQTP